MSVTAVPEICPNCSATVHNKFCSGCGNSFGRHTVVREKRKEQIKMPLPNQKEYMRWVTPGYSAVIKYRKHFRNVGYLISSQEVRLK